MTSVDLKLRDLLRDLQSTYVTKSFRLTDSLELRWYLYDHLVLGVADHLFNHLDDHLDSVEL